MVVTSRRTQIARNARAANGRTPRPWCADSASMTRGVAGFGGDQSSGGTGDVLFQHTRSGEGLPPKVSSGRP